MWELRRQWMRAIARMLAIAALVLATIGTSAIAAREVPPGAATGQSSIGAASEETEDTAPIDTDTDFATPAATDDQTDDTSVAGGESPAPSTEPEPSDQPSPSPTDSTSNGIEGSQPSPFPSTAPDPSPLPPSKPAATPGAEATVITVSPPSGGCRTNETAVPEVEVSGAGFGTPEFNGASYTPVTTTITVTLKLPTSGACLTADWSIDIAASAMQHDEGGMTRAGTIAYRGISGLTASAPGLTEAGLTPGTALSTAQTIVIGTNQTLDEKHPLVTFTVTLTWSPPATAPAGQYTSKITVRSIGGHVARHLTTSRI